MTSYELLEAYNIDLSVDPAIESLMDNAEIADRVYTSVLEQMDPAIESEYESIHRAAMEAEVATTSWFDRIRNAVSKFVAAVGNVLSSITRKLKLFFTKSNAKKAEKEAAELEEKIRKDQIKTIAEDKMPDLNCFTIESAMRMVAGTARSMGINVVGEFPSL